MPRNWYINHVISEAKMIILCVNIRDSSPPSWNSGFGTTWLRFLADPDFGPGPAIQLGIHLIFDALPDRVLHTLNVAADNGLTGHFRLARPHWNNMARLNCNAKFPNPLQMYEWVICFEINCTWKQMSHRVMFAYRWWPEISLIDENLLGIAASFSGYSKRSHTNCTCSHVNVRREICQDSQRQFHRWFINISHSEIFVIVLEVAVNLFTTGMRVSFSKKSGNLWSRHNFYYIFV